MSRMPAERALSTSLHIRGEAVARRVLEASIRGGAWLAPPHHGFTALFDERSEKDPEEALRLCLDLSRDLSTRVVALHRRTASYVVLLLAEGGTLIDRYDTREAETSGRVEALLPRCVPGVTAEALQAILRRHEAEDPVLAPSAATLTRTLAASLPPGLAAALGPKLGKAAAEVAGRVRALQFAERVAKALGQALGLEEVRVLAGYGWISRELASGPEGAPAAFLGSLVHLGKRPRRKARPQAG